MKPRLRVITLVLVIALLVAAIGNIALARDHEQQSTFAAPILVVNTSFLNVRTGPGVGYSVLVTVVGGTELPVLGVAPDGVWYQVATDGGPGWVNVTFTLPRGDFSNVPQVRADAPAAPGTSGSAIGISGRTATGYSFIGGDLRTEPSYDALIIRSAVPADPNTVYPLLGQTTDANGIQWYLVNLPGTGTGWIDKIELRPLECGTQSVGQVEYEVPIVFDGIANRDSFLIPGGTEGYIGERRGVLTVFELIDGTVGLVPSDSIRARPNDIVSVCTGVSTDLGSGGGAVVPQPARASGNHVVVNTSFLNIRSGPSAGFSVVATVPGGTELAVLGRASDGVWYLVEGPFGQGWLNVQFALFRGDFSTVPVIGQDDLPALGQGGGALPVDSIRSGQEVQGISILGGDMHAEPNFDSLKLISAITPETDVVRPLLGEATDQDGVTWYLVSLNGTTGWIDKAELRLLQCGTDSVVVVQYEVPIVFDGISNRDSFLIPADTEGYILGRRDVLLLVELVDGTVGYIPADSVQQRGAGVTSVCTGVQTTVVAAQADASTSSSTTVAATGNRVVVNTGNLNIRSGPSAGFSIVATVPGGTTLAVAGRTSDGIWYLVEGPFGQGWLNARFVVFRGDYSAVPVVNAQ